MNGYKEWKGLSALVVDAVVSGSEAIERAQRSLAETPFQMLEQVAPLAVPVKLARTVHDVSLTATHGAIRAIALAVGEAVEAGAAAAEKKD